MALDPSIILKGLTPGDVAKQQSEINATNTTTRTNQLLQPYEVQQAQLKNTQAAALNPLEVQEKKLGLAQNQLLLKYQLLNSIVPGNQNSLDMAHAQAEKFGVDPGDFPRDAAQITPELLDRYKQNILMMTKQMVPYAQLMQGQQRIGNDATKAAADSAGQALAAQPDGTLSAVGGLNNPAGATAPPATAPVANNSLANPGMSLPGASMPATSPAGPLPNVAVPSGQTSNLPPDNSPQAEVSNDVANENPLASLPAKAASLPQTQLSAQSIVQPQTVQAKIDAINNDPSLSVAGKNAALDRYKATPEYENYQTSLREVRNEQGEVGMGAGKSFNDMKAENDGAGPIIANLQQVLSDSKNFQMGAFANKALAAKQTLSALANAAGIKTPDLDESIGSQQALNKGVLQITMNSLTQTGEKSNQALNAFKSGLPSATMTENGLQQVAAGMLGTQQYKQAQFTAANAINANGGSLKNFNFQNNVSPMAFVLNNMTPANQIIFAHNLSKEPNGPSELKNLAKEIQWARTQPWAQQFNFAPQVAK